MLLLNQDEKNLKDYSVVCHCLLATTEIKNRKSLYNLCTACLKYNNASVSTVFIRLTINGTWKKERKEVNSQEAKTVK